MGLNIKNERTHDLVRQLAERSGLSQTAAVEDAVARRLAELSHPPRVDISHGIADLLVEIRSDLSQEDRQALGAGTDELYDADGLPR